MENNLTVADEDSDTCEINDYCEPNVQIYNEVFYSPRSGITLSLQTANSLLKRHLNKDCNKLKIFSAGFGNCTYVAFTTDGSQYVIRLSGKPWSPKRVENEVATMKYVSQTSRIVTPKVYHFNNNPDEIGAPYIIMERIAGKPLHKLWLNYTFEEKVLILEQIAEYYAQFCQLEFKEIGSLEFSDKNIKVGPIMMNVTFELPEQAYFMIGPFRSFSSYFCALVEVAIKILKSPCLEHLKQHRTLIQRLQKFLDQVIEAGRIPEQTKFILWHHDMALGNGNILANGTQITGLVDWEATGVVPLDEMWNRFDSMFDNLGEDSETIRLLKNKFLETCKVSDVPTPDTIPSYENRQILFNFEKYITAGGASHSEEHINKTYEYLVKVLEMYGV